jgi:purine-binding chemotaxis protein CheW
LLRPKRFGIFISLKHMGDSGAFRAVLFRLGSVLWATPATLVREVIAAERPTRIPGADRIVAGLVNLRGTLLTVLDGRRAVGLSDAEAEGGSILVLEQGGRAYGLSIDEVLDLIDVQPGDLTQGAAPAGLDPRLVRAHGRHGGRTFAVLNTEALFAPVLG